MDQETIGKVLSIVFSAVVALLAVAGYHVAVVAPQLAAVAHAAAAACK